MGAPKTCQRCGSDSCTVQTYAGDVALCDPCLTEVQAGPQVQASPFLATISATPPNELVMAIFEAAKNPRI